MKDMTYKIKKAIIEGEPEILRIIVEFETPEIESLREFKKALNKFENHIKGQKELIDIK